MYHLGRVELAHARWKSRRLLAVVSFSFGVGETNCSQGMEEGDVTEKDEDEEDGIRFSTLESRFENETV